MNDLVGFDTSLTKARGWDWLIAQGYYRRDELGNILRGQGAPSGQESQCRALEGVIESIVSTEHMYGPERIAGKRWSKAIDSLTAALADFLPYADIREREDDYFASKKVDGADDPVPKLTREVHSLARHLLSQLGEARSQILIYKDDPLPGIDGTKPHFDFLAKLECRLFMAGFSYSVIGDLIRDHGREEDDRERPRVARARHVERIRKRVQKFKIPMALKAKRLDLEERAMASFTARTGRKMRGGSALKAWFQSPEAKQLEDQVANLTALPTRRARTGK